VIGSYFDVLKIIIGKDMGITGVKTKNCLPEAFLL